MLSPITDLGSSLQSVENTGSAASVTGSESVTVRLQGCNGLQW
jgi:hypothetical protein